MGEKRYMISDAAKKVDVEAHVLRYWEDEVGIEIPRNEMGHRYYRKEDIVLLRSVKDLKEKGFQLKAIKLLLPDLPRIEAMDSARLSDLRQRLDLVLGTEGLEEEANESEKQQDKPEPESDKLMEPIPEDNEPDKNLMETEYPEPYSDSLDTENTKNKLNQFRTIMNDIIRSAMEGNNRHLIEEMNQCLTESVTREMDILLRLREEREEERFRGIDRLIRERQNSRGQAAAAKEPYGGKHRRKESKFFRKHDVHI